METIFAEKTYDCGTQIAPTLYGLLKQIPDRHKCVTACFHRWQRSFEGLKGPFLTFVQQYDFTWP